MSSVITAGIAHFPGEKPPKKVVDEGQLHDCNDESNNKKEVDEVVHQQVEPGTTSTIAMRRKDITKAHVALHVYIKRPQTPLKSRGAELHSQQPEEIPNGSFNYLLHTHFAPV
jgi:hypothetical protein